MADVLSEAYKAGIKVAIKADVSGKTLLDVFKTSLFETLTSTWPEYFSGIDEDEAVDDDMAQEILNKMFNGDLKTFKDAAKFLEKVNINETGEDFNGNERH